MILKPLLSSSVSSHSVHLLEVREEVVTSSFLPSYSFTFYLSLPFQLFQLIQHQQQHQLTFQDCDSLDSWHSTLILVTTNLKIILQLFMISYKVCSFIHRPSLFLEHHSTSCSSCTSTSGEWTYGRISHQPSNNLLGRWDFRPSGHFPRSPDQISWSWLQVFNNDLQKVRKSSSGKFLC